MKLGLTGGIGCGKSTVGSFLQKIGWLRIDSDALVRELLDSDALVQAALRAHFGPEALLPYTAAATDALRPNAMAEATPHTATGAPPHTATEAPQQSAPRADSLYNRTNRHDAPLPRFIANRALIAMRVFADPAERLWLEALLHPRVRELWQAKADAAGGLPVVIEIPLLFEKNLEKHFDLAVCVEADRHVQLARLQSRGMSPADAEARIASQMPLAEKIARADKVLSNNGTEDFLRTQALRLNNELPVAQPCTD